MDEIRVGIVGADAQGQGWAPLAHFPALRALPEYRISALCTTREETARAAAARYGVATAHHDYRALCADPAVDLVAVVVRAPNHYDVVMAALGARKHVYCEWPLAVETAQAEAMAALARSSGVRAAVGLQARCDPTLRYARDVIARGDIGDVLAVTMAMLTGAAPERPRTRLWEAQPAGGVSALTVRTIHSLDAMCFCVGELASVSARLSTQTKRWRVSGTDDTVAVEVPDNVLVAGALASGAAVSAHIATLPCAAPGLRLEIHGSEGALRITTAGAPQRDANALMAARGRGAFEPLAVPVHYREVPEHTPAGPPNNVAHLYRRLAHAIRSGAPITPGFDDAVRRHRLIDAIRRSSAAAGAAAVP